MKKIIFSFITLFICANSIAQVSDSLQLKKIFNYYLSESKCYSNLEYLTTKIESRLSGSPGAAKAVDWAKQAMYEAGADNVILQPCMVPHWIRGEKEVCYYTNQKTKKKNNFSICALGGSVATPKEGINAEVMVVNSFDELDLMGEKLIKGKIVFYNAKFNETNLTTGKSYGETVKYRWAGASKAAKYGAVATIVRSMSSIADDFPHTGTMKYDTTISKIEIPTCAISFLGANSLDSLIKMNKNAKVFLKLSCKTLPKEKSYNVIGEIKGTSKSDEIILVGGHLDAWDNGQGAHDDGAGVVQSIEVLAAFKALGIKPKHTIRAVAFMNEENGGAGGEAYFNDTKEKKIKHIAALETDAGGFSPRGIAVDTLMNAYAIMNTWKQLLDPYFLQYIKKGGHGADIEDLQSLGVPLIGFEPDGQRYFDYHHTSNDTFDKVNKRELSLSAALIASIIYLIDQKGWESK